MRPGRLRGYWQALQASLRGFAINPLLVCALKTGGDFDESHALRLADQFAAHAPVGVDFICLTDEPRLRGAAWARPLEHGWPGWWSKIEAFRLPGPVLYLDLDVNIVGDLAPLIDAARRHPFVICRSFTDVARHVVNSSVMAWRGDVSELYREFAAAPAAHMSTYGDPQRWTEPGRGWGDQGFVRDHWRGPVAFWQDVCPNAVQSFKVMRAGMLKRSTDAAIVCSHGRPRPWARGGADSWLSTQPGT